jgi:hypothetical protein
LGGAITRKVKPVFDFGANAGSEELFLLLSVIPVDGSALARACSAEGVAETVPNFIVGSDLISGFRASTAMLTFRLPEGEVARLKLSLTLTSVGCVAPLSIADVELFVGLAVSLLLDGEAMCRG